MNGMTTTQSRKRVSKGQPTGGQFSSSPKAEADVALEDKISVQAVHTDPNAFYELALSPETTSAELERLIDADHWLVNNWVASNSNLSEDAQLRFVNNYDLGVRNHLVRNPAVSSNTLHYLAADQVHEIRALVAIHPATNVEDLRELATDGDLTVLAALASNPSSPDDVLEQLAQHPTSGFVREQVAIRRGELVPA